MGRTSSGVHRDILVIARRQQAPSTQAGRIMQYDSYSSRAQPSNLVLSVHMCSRLKPTGCATHQVQASARKRLHKGTLAAGLERLLARSASTPHV